MNREYIIFFAVSIVLLYMATDYFLHSARIQRKNESKPEFECRRVLEERFKKPFISVRPDWLRNPESGACMELDCYNEELKLAVEYNGEQHYKYIPKFHVSKAHFEKQLRRDKEKKKICEERGVNLLIIPHTVKDIRKTIYEWIV